MNHEITLRFKSESLPRIMGFLVGQTGEPDDRYSWTKDNKFTGKDGITWGFEPEDLCDMTFLVGCYNSEHYASVADADEGGAIYVCSDSLDGRSQAYDARSVVAMANKCLGGNLKTIFGLIGGDAWPSL